MFGRGGKNRSDEPHATFQRSLAELEIKQQTNVQAWRLGSAGRWNADLEQGLITFSFSDGMVASASLQVIGTLNLTDGTWLWGWDHPSVKAELARHALLVRDFGERYKLTELTTRKIACAEADAWRFTAVASHLANATGAYRGPFGSTSVYMTFGNVSLSRLN